MANQMTKAQLVAALAERTGGDKKAAGAALEALTGIITETVAQGGAVTLPGVGKFYCRERPERTARNPSTDEQIQKPADKMVKITVAKALKDGGDRGGQGAGRLQGNQAQDRPEEVDGCTRRRSSAPLPSPGSSGSRGPRCTASCLRLAGADRLRNMSGVQRFHVRNS